MNNNARWQRPDLLRLHTLLAGLLPSSLLVTVRAADGDVVPSFAPQLTRGGQVTQIIVQPDGKILLAGQFTTVNGVVRPALARLNADGALDASFIPAASLNAFTPPFLLLQRDGRILLRNTPFRLNSDGSRDASFNPGMTNYLAVLPDGRIAASNSPSGYMTGLSRLAANGAVEIERTSTFMGNVVFISLAAVQADGKLVFAGNFFHPARCPGLGRLTADWGLEIAFPAADCSGGIGLGLGHAIASITPLPDGKIYLAGSFTSYGGVARPGLVRLNADGSLDASFVPASLDGAVRNVIPLPDGRLLIAGNFANTGGTPRARLARLNADGSLDASFPANGLSFNGAVAAIAVQADGKILVGGGFTKVGDSARLGLARLNADGALDTAFNVTTTAVETAGVNIIRRTAEGKFLVAGSFNQVSGVERPGLARLNADGSLDASFSPAAAEFSPPALTEVLPNGKVLLVSNTERTTRLLRLNADGSLDTAFRAVGFEGRINALVVQADGRLLLGGYLPGPVNVFYTPLLRRLSAEGVPDPSFVFNNQDYGIIGGLYVLPDGRILAGREFAHNEGAPPYNLARLNSNGVLDPAFTLAVDGWVRTFLPYPGGKILLSGSFSKLAGATRRGLAVINSDGMLDAAFTPALSQPDYQSHLVSVLPDGRVLRASGGQILRLNADGGPDFAFSFPVWTGAGETRGFINALLALPDGRALAGGAFYQAGRARTVRPLLALFEAGGPALALSAAAIASAANYRAAVAGDSIISIFGAGLASGAAVARALPLPTVLNGVRVKLISNEAEMLELPLFFVSGQQINCHLPAPPRAGYLVIENNEAAVAVAPLNALRTAPGLFTADGSGKGYPAAQVLRINNVTGARAYEPVVVRDAAGQLVARSIELGPETEQVFLVLYGTGASLYLSINDAALLLGEAPAQVQYLGPAPGLIGVDQINALIPRSLKGVNRAVEVKLTVAGLAANVVKINIK